MVAYYGVIYDAITLAPRRVILPSDSNALFDGTHGADAGEVFCTISREYIEHLIPDLGEMAREAIRQHSGREPPTMEDVHRNKL